MLKYSRQRKSIKDFLSGRKDHPTAETIYLGVKESHPQISLGTIYRNLSLMTELGEIKKITALNGPDRFDGNCNLHYHFFCVKCGGVLDLEMDSIEHINVIASHKFKGQIKGSHTQFYGLCPQCADNEKNNKINFENRD